MPKPTRIPPAHSNAGGNNRGNGPPDHSNAGGNGKANGGNGNGNGQNDTPTLSVSDTSVTEGGELVYTVTLSRASATPVTVSYATANGTAQTADYAAQTGTLTYAAGQTSQTVAVPTTGDTTDESNETVLLNLSNPSGATVADSQGVGTITDNDDAVVTPPPTGTQPTITILDSSVQEGGNLNFRVYLDKPATSPITFNYATSPGTAQSSTDYSFQSGGRIIPTGQQYATIGVPTRLDSLDEADETLTMTLSNIVGATVNDAVATGTIRDDDPAPGTFTPPTTGMSGIRVLDATVAEGGELVFEVVLSAPSSVPVSYRITSTDGSARGETIGPEPNQVDYQPYTATGTFLPGDPLTQQHRVLTYADGVTESNENMFMLLNDVSNAFVDDNFGEGTILGTPINTTSSVFG